jgi:hypothetical protein
VPVYTYSQNPMKTSSVANMGRGRGDGSYIEAAYMRQRGLIV